MFKIFIAEDAEAIANLMRMVLSKFGYSCTCVYDGLEAADLLERETYDLLLLDIMLPDADGYSLLKYSKALNIPTFFITVKTNVIDRIKRLRMGDEDYISHLFEIAELVARVEVVLRRFHKLKKMIQLFDITVNCDSMTVLKSNTEIPLTNAV